MDELSCETWRLPCNVINLLYIESHNIITFFHSKNASNIRPFMKEYNRIRIRSQRSRRFPIRCSKNAVRQREFCLASAARARNSKILIRPKCHINSVNISMSLVDPTQ